MRIGLIAMSGVRVVNPKLAELGVTLPQFLSRGWVEQRGSRPSLLGAKSKPGGDSADCFRG